MKRPARVTLADVARLARVSAMTVSRALNTPEKVDAALRERVAQACAQLDYIPSRAARALASARSRLVVALAPAGDPACEPLLEGLGAALHEAGYLMAIARVDPAHPALDARALALRAFLPHAPEAVALAGLAPDADLLALLGKLDLPWTEACGAGADAKPPRPGAGAPPEAVGETAIAHLRANGRRRIGVLAALGEAGAQGRLAGAIAAWTAATKDQDVPQAIHPAAPGPALGQALLAELLAARPDCDAVYCTHDLLAWGALAHCRQAGIAVPDRLLLIGTHDLPATRWLTPPLASVATRRDLAGRQAALELIARVEGPARRARWYDTGHALRTHDAQPAAAG